MRTLALMLFALPANAGMVLIEWQNDTSRVFEATKIYYWDCSDPGRHSGAWQVWPTDTSVTLPFAPGQWCFDVKHVTAEFTEFGALSVTARELPQAVPPVLH